MRHYGQEIKASPRLKRFIEVIAVLSLCSFPLFYRLDSLAIRQWDEARNAVSAVEMYRNHNFIVRYFDGVPDFFDVKPPLLIWLQVMFIKLVGMNELAIRLPSAFAALLTVIFLIRFFSRMPNNRLTGYLAALILVTTQGYIDRHMARTGDHDSLLVLFTSMIILLYYEFLVSNQNVNRKLITLAVLIVLAILTKSIAVFMILPGLLIMTFVYGRQKRLFLNKTFYACLVGVVLIGAGYYTLRETMQPGYLKAVWSGELLPRYLNTHSAFLKEPGCYYIRNLAKERFSYWIVFLVPALIILPWWYRKQKQNLPLYLLINILVYLAIISAGTYNLWYDGPILPLLAAFTAYFLVWLLQYLKPVMARIPVLGNHVIFLLLPALFLLPGIIIVEKVKRTTEFPWDTEIYSMCHALGNIRGIPGLGGNELVVVFEGYPGHLQFYTERNEYLNDINTVLKPIESCQPGDYVMLSQESVLEKIKDWSYVEVYQNAPVLVIQIRATTKSFHQP
jgi:4-amino-4-deoxy-L-arabinose transferase-like glycosyltransferase